MKDDSMTDSMDWLPFLRLRQEVEELRYLRKPPAKTNVACPRLSVALWDENDAVDLKDLLTATVSAIARSRSKLTGAGGIALADDPIPFTFKGELAGVSERAENLWLVVKAEERKANNG